MNLLLTSRRSSSLFWEARLRFSHVAEGGSELPHQVGYAGWWRESSARLLCQRRGALEGLVGPCEAGDRTPGRQVGKRGQQTEKRPCPTPPSGRGWRDRSGLFDTFLV